MGVKAISGHDERLPEKQAVRAFIVRKYYKSIVLLNENNSLRRKLQY
jgi:hypothetical protein